MKWATPIHFNSEYSGSLYNDKETDWYSFNLEEDVVVSIDFTTPLIGDTTNYWEIVLVRLTDVIEEVESWNISGIKNKTTIPEMELEAAQYYLRIEKSINYSSETYTFSVKSDSVSNNNIMRDVNLDGKFGVADIVIFQKWLLAVPGVTLEKWENADFCTDGKLDVFDLCMMKKALIS